MRNSTSIMRIWQVIHQHYGFYSTGAHFIDLSDIVKYMIVQNRPHCGQPVSEDKEMTPTLENFVVSAWLCLIHSDLPRLVKQQYSTELQSRTLASIKPEILQALDSMLNELHANDVASAILVLK